MSRRARFLTAAIALAALVLAVSAYLHSWGGLVMVVVAAAGVVWYRMQVAQTEATERFFGDPGDDTRLTGFQGGSPSEMPLDRTTPAALGTASRERSTPPAP
jgi:hypothetical protein